MNLADRVPSAPTSRLPEATYDAFTGWVSERGLNLYPAQDEAVMELVEGHHVILATPTGSGKSMVAVAAHFAAMARGERSYYTAPIKALVSEKFFDLISIFGAKNVGMVTGDSSVNPDAPIICCTAEIVANLALRHGAQADVGVVIMDEFHFYADAQRGWAWQVPLLTLPQVQFLLLSATLGPTEFFENDLTERTGRKAVTVSGVERPIPLHHHWGTEPIQETLEELAHTHRAPVYVVHFSQLEAIERAQGLLSVNLCTKEEKARIAEVVGGFRFASGFGKTLSKMLRQGIGVHHAGMLPKYRRLVEQLAQAGLLKVICGTDTLGVGINVPIRTVLITALSKFDGERTRHLTAREYHQIAGRAGRAGYDTAGDVVVQAPEHEIENAKAMAKARSKFGEDQKKLRQVKKKSAPQGFVSWSEKTFERLVHADPEPLTSSFKVTHSMLLNLLARDGDSFQAASTLLTDNHEPPVRRRGHLLRALGILRELLATGVVERTQPDRWGNVLALTVTLQENFALNQPLSGFAVAALELFDPEDPAYALDVLTVIESTLESPHQVIGAQVRFAKGEAIGAMKADGVDYNERMARLDDVHEPRPLENRLQPAFEQYREGAGWLADQELKPKSVVRDMFERACDFGDYIRQYQLARSEGVLLRYLTDAYKALRQTVPQDERTEGLQDLVAWLGEIIEQTDSSLLDEWEALAAGKTPAQADEELAKQPARLTDNERAFRVLVRNQLFRRVQLFGREDDRGLAALDPDDGFSADDWADLLDDYFAEHEDLDDGPAGRSPALLKVTPGKNAEGHRVWTCRQTFADPAGDHDWGFDAVVDLDASDEAGEAVVRVTGMGRLDG
ncbi:MAG: DEAD/DEAH box helicase [Galactobacter sp.]